MTAFHRLGCSCGACASSKTALFAEPASAVDAIEASATETEAAAVGVVPEEVEAMDGVESPEEAHNVERPARQQLKKKKGNQGKPLSDFEVGSTVKGTVKSIAGYGAFIDIGATTDGLLHVSQLSTEFVNDVSEVLSEQQEVEVRIIKLDKDKNQIGLSLITVKEEEAANEAQQSRRSNSGGNNNNNQNRRQGGGGGGRRDDSAVLATLQEKGWDPDVMVEGTVVSTVDFGCFVRVDASTLNAEAEGEFDGLVHISAMSTKRVKSSTDIVSPDQKVQVRVRSIDGGKVSLTMLSVEDESNKNEAAAAAGETGAVREGARDWKEQLVKLDDEMPSFQNLAMVEDRRK